MKFKTFLLITIAVALGFGFVEALKAYMQIQSHKSNCYQVAQQIINEDKSYEAAINSTEDLKTKYSIMLKRSQRPLNSELYDELNKNCKAYEKEISQWMKSQGY